MIGFLRFIGLMNAAVWLGTTVFFAFGSWPACFSTGMLTVLRASAPDTYYPGAIAQVIMGRFYMISLACAVVALLHFLCQWLYMGRPSRKFSSVLVISLFVITLVGSNALAPALTRLNRHRFAAAQPAERQSATRRYQILRGVEEAFNILMIGGLVVYTWRIANPSDTLRFVSPVKFRS